jgi:hypothetical protein
MLARRIRVLSWRLRKEHSWTRDRLAALTSGGAIIALVFSFLLSALVGTISGLAVFGAFDDDPPEVSYSAVAKDSKAKIDPLTGEGTPWTIVWDHHHHYDYTRGNGQRAHPGPVACCLLGGVRRRRCDGDRQIVR